MNTLKFTILLIGALICFPWSAAAGFVYAGLIGGIDRGDGAALPALGFKMAGDPESGMELTYARGGIQSEGSYFEKERVLAITYRAATGGSVAKSFIGLGAAVLDATSEAEGRSQSSIVGAMAINAGISLGFLKMGIDTFLGMVPGTVPLYALGVRNFWYVGFQIVF